MSTLPLDIFPSILDSLRVYDLTSCSVVSRDLHRMTQGPLFSHLRLSCWQWDARCQFFLSIATESRCSLVKKLTIELDELNDSSPDLISLLIKLGPRVTTLHIDGFVRGKEIDEWPTSTWWPNLSPAFVDCLFQHVMPSVRSLRFHEVGAIPIFLVFAHCPLLRDFWLGSLYLDGPQTDTTNEVGSDPVPNVVSLMFKPFAPDDLEETTPLAHFIKQSGHRITSLHLNQKEEGGIFQNLDDLQPFPDLKANLKHLYLGRRFHFGVVQNIPREFDQADLLPLASFPSLQTLTFPMYNFSSQEAWDCWFKWIAAVMSLAGDSIPPSLKAIRFIHFPQISPSDSFGGTPHSLDKLYDKGHFSLEFVMSQWIRKEKLSEAFALVRTIFPSWEAAGRLSFRIKI
ncbi:hypothetical protein DL96DRAFT_1721746 [Flagelloscypha sp. PMI_526]|nr:hypothetical protein DL96DRAFT_1721746 [Flagelloscypha sp. PMI_526]